MVSERTPLRSASDATPPYVFMTNPNRAYRKKIREFQCCVCGSMLIVITLAVLTISYFTADYGFDDLTPMNDTGNSTLLTMEYPQAGDTISSSSNDAKEEKFQKALRYGQQQLQEKDILEDKTPSLDITSPSYKHQQSMKTSDKALYLARIGYAINKATESIIRDLPHSEKFTVDGKVPNNDDWLPNDWCDFVSAQCSRFRYREIDGSCNNLEHSLMWGVAFRPFRRVIPPQYCNGYSSPRCGTDKSALPSAREVSVKIHRPSYRFDSKFTVMLAVWGQFIDHDITATALSKGKEGDSIACCSVPSEERHPECFPVTIPTSDPYYNQFNVTCMEFVRSAPSPTCILGPREQMNQVSSFLDGSAVYGNTEELADSLRTFHGGSLKMSYSKKGKPLLPISVDFNDGCNREEENAKGRYCFISGDARANENIHLTSLHLIMARQHNRLAKELMAINPHWNDETIYQEARRIVSAQIQHITYNEFLSILFGPKLMSKFQLDLSKAGYFTGYNNNTDPSISNSFAAAAFRFAHTLIPGLIKVIANGSYEDYVEMHKMLFNPYSLYKSGSLDNILSGAMDTHIERSDNFFNSEMTQHLFESADSTNSSKMCGLDLVSLNIQRGRDHGLPGYPKWREYCGLSIPKKFSDLSKYVDKESVKVISSMYRSVDDIDLYTGALSEIPVPGGLLGPTAMCLVGDQFMRLRIGDRFWYETHENPQAFTIEQLQEIRKTTLAKIICDNADEVTNIQPFVMKSKGSDNSKITCTRLPHVDLKHWKDEKPAEIFNSEEPRVGLYLTSGRIRIGPSEFPITYPLELPSGANLQRMNWSGVFQLVGSFLHGSGTFNLQEQYGSRYINGIIDFNARIMWNTTDLNSFVSNKNYTIYVMFCGSQKEIFRSKYSTLLPLNVTDLTDPLLLIILNGKCPKSKRFNWDGHLSFLLPSLRFESYNFKEIVLPIKEGNVIRVTGGNVSVNESNLSKIFWSSKFPMEIPTSLDRGRMSQSCIPTFSLIWKVSSVSRSEISGSYELPKLIESPNKYFNIKWITGNFSFFMKLKKNVVLEESFLRKGSFISTVILGDSHSNNSVYKEICQEHVDYNLLKLIVNSQKYLGSLHEVPIILQGQFSSDKLILNWNGKLQLKFKNKVEIPIEQNFEFSKSSYWFENYFGAHIYDGFYRLNGSSKMSLVKTPLKIPLKLTENNGTYNYFHVIWSGLVSENSLKASFQLPDSLKSLNSSRISWLRGEFKLKLRSFWNNSLSKFLNVNQTYFSKVVLEDQMLAVTDIKDGINIASEYKNMTLGGIFTPIILQGTYSHQKKYFYWNGNVMLRIQNRGKLRLGGKEEFQKVNKEDDSQKTKKNDPNLDKLFLSFLLKNGVIDGSLEGDNPIKLFTGNPPISIKVDDVIDKDSFKTSFDLVWSVFHLKNDNLMGNFKFPSTKKKSPTDILFWAGNFSFTIETMYDSSVDIIILENEYTCNVLFQATAESSYEEGNPTTKLTTIRKTPTDVETCTIILSGNYYKPSIFCYIVPWWCSNEKYFYWSGYAELMIRKPFYGSRGPKVTNNKIADSSSGNGKNNPAQVNNERKSPTEKSEYLLVNVQSGMIVGSLDDNRQTVLFDGTFPKYIYLDSIVDLNSYGYKGDVTWSATYQNLTLEGTFKIPAKIKHGKEILNQWWNGNFSVQLNKKSGDSLDIIVPRKEYSCSLFFKTFEKDENPDKENFHDQHSSKNGNMNNGEKIVGNNPPTETCSVIMVGTFYKQSFLCYIFPWWCADEKIFIWTGDVSLSIKKPPSVIRKEKKDI